MPPSVGEERIVTVFADIHYYFTEPTPRPSPYHHRFDKGSYVYIYHDAAQNKARIEIANNPGCPEQDAFCGVDAHSPSPQHQQYAQAIPQHEWRLPSGGPSDDPKDYRTLPRLHTLDIYFWAQDDATDFLDAAVRVLASAQIETDREPAPQPQQSMSSVVEQLESIAVSDPAYQNGQTPNSRSEPIATAAPVFPGPPQTSSFPPPPPSGPPAVQQSSANSPAEEKRDSASFAPLPYNPAAPAAPEPIQHREKTPPPEDGMNGTGLAAAVAADNGIPFTPPQQLIGGIGGVSGFASPPPSNPGLQYAGPPIAGAPSYASPPPSAGLQHSNSFSTPRSSLSSPGVPAASYSQPFAGAQGAQQYTASRQNSMSFAPPPQDPNAHLYDQQVYGGGVQAQPPPQQQPGAAVPVGGFSNFTYGQTQAQQHQRSGSEYDIHSQLYRPTEVEASSHYQKYAQKAMKHTGQRSKKMEDRAERLEGGMNRFFKKLERKL
ncbi:hypothetical protein N7457_009104 [Penicillium paradoxum]|uniref:uncharacterized protein n=1 Tax=Penicillium paradoxum TaxID=176176 RepID=UPI002547D7CD|nr:uncharacterized protein N7457_009104 [Penicillium paradoxum]KAJ5774208.1 hypothetical protein N7457_009104 [Penicillium paradoxum]